MTSSLVGSEMCIRDSESGKSETLTKFQSANLDRLEHKYHQVGSGGAQPVSYTHLTLPTICSV
eukprot:10022037-Prorocentrum_lima.AAC.1